MSKAPDNGPERPRYFLRPEFFGGLLYDTVEKDYFRLDPLATAIVAGGAQAVSPAMIREHESSAEEVLELQAYLDAIGATSRTRILADRSRPDRLSAPLRVFYDISYRCPEACAHCFTDSDQADPNELALEEKLSFVDQMAEMGTFRISIAGGEPLASRDLFPFIEHALARNVDVSLSTNGTLITERNAKRLASLGVRTINISIDGWDDESFGRVRGYGRLKYVVRGVQNLRRWYDGKISAKCTLMTTNLLGLDRIVAFCKALGFDEVKFNCVREAGRASDQPTLIPSRIEYLLATKALAEIVKRGGDGVKIVMPVNPYLGDHAPDVDVISELGFGCYAGKESYCINPVGDVQPCSSFGRDRFVDGNVRDRGLQDIWLHGESNLAFAGLSGASECKSCKSYDGCRGGCYLRSYGATGDLNGLDPYCYEHDPATRPKDQPRMVVRRAPVAGAAPVG